MVIGTTVLTNPNPQANLSSRPERTRISCHATLDEAAYAPFRKEGRMKCVNATKSNRKSGVAQWRDLQFSPPPNRSPLKAPGVPPLPPDLA
jgi:hypothetical protein